MEPATVDNQDIVFELKTLPKNTFEIKATVPWLVVKDNQHHALTHIAQETEIKGFRKGKAPLDMVEKSIQPSVLLESTLDHLLPSTYQQAIQKYNIKPIIDPKVRALSTDKEKDWEFTFTVCGLPEVELGDYKTGLKGISSTQAIWTPGKGEDKQKEPTAEEKQNHKINESVKWLIDNAKIEISDLLIENERGRKLSRLLDSVQKLGLSLDQYLANVGKTSDQLVADYNLEAENELKIEMLLQRLADAENISVDPAEVDKAISEAKTPEEKSALEKQRYALTSLLRRQKTLDFLANL